MALPRIRILATGGTIAGETCPGGDLTRYRAGVRPVSALLTAVPELGAFATLDAEQILSLDSKDMTPDDWLCMLSAARQALADPAIDGLVLLHGTDTLEESAYFLHLALPTGKPVVLTGAMRPADHPRPDGPANLLAAVKLVGQQAKTEASGGVNLKTVRAIAMTGVDYISVGALTHSARAVDMGLDFES